MPTSLIAQWNLARLAESLLPLMHEEREDAIGGGFLERLRAGLQRQMARHDGLQARAAEAKKKDESLITDLLDWMHENGADYTNTFLDLSQKELPNKELYATENFQAWQTRWVRLRKKTWNPRP